jgi:hypothetical protein
MTVEFVDGLITFDLGINSNLPRLLLPKNQLAFATNATVRGSFLSPRPTIRKINLSFQAGVDTDAFHDGLFQGKAEYQADDGTASEVWAIAGKLYHVVPDSDVTATVTLVSTGATEQDASAPQHWLWQAEKWIIWNDGVSNPVFFDGATCTRSNYSVVGSAGVVASNLTVNTGIGTSVTVTVSLDPTGLVSVGDLLYIPASAAPAQLVLSVTGTTANTITGTNTNLNASATNIFIYGVGIPLSYGSPNATQLPPGRMGTYGMGRVWQCLPDGKQFVAGDLVGGSSGTLANNFRDAVLNVTENGYLAGGGNFTVPGTVGSIRAMRFTTTLDASLGQGPLQVFTPTTVFSCQAPVDRLTWQNLQNPILTESLIGAGALGQNSTIGSNNDMLFRSLDGIRSLKLARLEFDTWGNVPISREVQRVIDQDNTALLAYGSAVVFGNRMLMTAQPTASDQGVFHQGLIALNFDPLSNINGKKPSVYDGLWTGLNILQIGVNTDNAGQRCFATCLNVAEGTKELWEVQADGAATADDGYVPIIWELESPVLFKDVKKGIFDPIELDDGEISIDNVVGRVDFRAYYRPDQYACWVPWTSFSVCNDASSTQRAYKTRIGLGQPDINQCDANGSGKPFRIGNTFQFKLVIQGHCVFFGAKFKAHLSTQTKWAIPACPCPADPVPKQITYEFVHGGLNLFNPGTAAFLHFGLDSVPPQLFIDSEQVTKAKLAIGYLQALNPDDGLWYAITANEDPPQFQVQPISELTAVNPAFYKIDGTKLYLKNPATGLYHQVTIGGAPAQLQLSFVGIQ